MADVHSFCKTNVQLDTHSGPVLERASSHIGFGEERAFMECSPTTGSACRRVSPAHREERLVSLSGPRLQRVPTLRALSVMILAVLDCSVLA